MITTSPGLKWVKLKIDIQVMMIMKYDGGPLHITCPLCRELDRHGFAAQIESDIEVW